MKIYIKYMGSLRCKMMVKDELRKLGLRYTFVEPGMAEILDDITDYQRKELKNSLKRCGLEMMDEESSMLIEKIVSVIVEMVHYSDHTPEIVFSEYITDKLQMDYDSLNKIFAEVKGTSIAQSINIHKLERVKELMLYEDLGLAEIAHLLHYSSAEELYNQFKTYTGLSPTFFKELKQKRKHYQA